MTVFYKDPNAKLDYRVDWSAWLNGDTVATVAWTVPTGLTKTSETNTTTAATDAAQTAPTWPPGFPRSG